MVRPISASSTCQARGMANQGARFGASFYTRIEDKFSLPDNQGEAPLVNTAIDQT
jgi:hypothetical protein